MWTRTPAAIRQGLHEALARVAYREAIRPLKWGEDVGIPHYWRLQAIHHAERAILWRGRADAGM